MIPPGEDELAHHLTLQASAAAAVGVARVWLDSHPAEEAAGALDFLEPLTVHQLVAVIGILGEHAEKGAVLALAIASHFELVTSVREKAIFVLSAFARGEGLAAAVARHGLGELAGDPEVGAAAAAALASLSAD